MSSKEESDEKVVKPIFINPTKKYGLIINKPQAKKTILPNSLSESLAKQRVGPKPCIFDEDDDDDNDAPQGKNALTSTLAKKVNSGMSGHMKKQTQIDIEKALAQDATVFEYDEIYDKVEEQKGKLDPKQHRNTESKEPKYMAGLMKAAAKRKMEFEKLQERKIQKEREAEGDMWGDKEVFVTSSYRAKLEERQRLEEEERNQERIESLLDVTKQRDLSGFYTSMLKMKSGELVIEEESEKEKRLLREKQEAEEKRKAQSVKQPKHYRKVKEESSESEDEPEVKEPEEKEEQEEMEIAQDDAKPNESAENSSKQQEAKEGGEGTTKEPEAKKIKTSEDGEQTETVKKEEENLPRLSKEEKRAERLKKLFTKRTVGEVFDRELAEYFLRKSTILSIKSYIERES